VCVYLCSIFITVGDTWSVTLRKESRLGLGTLVMSPETFMAESNRKLEKTPWCIAS